MKKKKKLLTALIAALLTGTLVMPSCMAFADEVVVEKPGSDAEESTNAGETEENGNDSENEATLIDTEENKSRTITYSASEGGTVSTASETVTGDAAAQGSTATPNEGYVFDSWKDAYGITVSKDAAFIPDAKEDASYRAYFKEDPSYVQEGSVKKDIGDVSVDVSGEMPNAAYLIARDVTYNKTVTNAVDGTLDNDETFDALCTLDLSLKYEGKKWQPKDNGSDVTVTVSGIDAGKDTKVYYVSDDKKTVTPVECTVNEDGSVSFVTNHFSTYTVGNAVTANAVVTSGSGSDSSGATKVDAVVVNEPDLSGTAYAVLGSDGTLWFVRSKETFTNGTTGTVTSISGGTYTGTIYTGFEETTFFANGDYWNSTSQTIKIKKVDFVDNIKPMVTENWFYFQNLLTEIDNADKLIMSNVTSTFGMFWGCYSLPALDVSNWDTSNVVSMEYMFNSCGSLAVLDVSKWNTSKVIYMGGMFDGCGSITTLDVSGWDTSKVTNMTYMFSGCSNLSRISTPRVQGTASANLPATFYLVGDDGDATLDSPSYTDLAKAPASSVIVTVAAMPHDLTLTAKTSGNMGAKSKYFAYTVSICEMNSDGTAKRSYTSDGITTPGFTVPVDITSADSTVPSNNFTDSSYIGKTNPTTLTADANGIATGTFYLKDGQSIILRRLPSDTAYQVKTAEETYTASYAISGDTSLLASDGDFDSLTDGSGTKRATVTDTVSSVSSDTVTDYSIDKDTTLTATNTLEAAVPTGIVLNAMPYIIAACIAAAVIATEAKKKRNAN